MNLGAQKKLPLLLREGLGGEGIRKYTNDFVGIS
jgi:hypothetical protein